MDCFSDGQVSFSSFRFGLVHRSGEFFGLSCCCSSRGFLLWSCLDDAVLFCACLFFALLVGALPSRGSATATGEIPVASKSSVKVLGRSLLRLIAHLRQWFCSTCAKRIISATNETVNRFCTNSLTKLPKMSKICLK